MMAGGASKEFEICRAVRRGRDDDGLAWWTTGLEIDYRRIRYIVHVEYRVSGGERLRTDFVRSRLGSIKGVMYRMTGLRL